ncbi:MAG: hypothetical protein ABI321_05280 [Polyangia bacterium]
MKRNVLVVCLSLLAAACGGGGRSSLSSCEALAKCCDSLPSASAGSCGSLASATDQAACDASLKSLQSASYCKGVTTSQGPSSNTKNGGCDQYLACLLIAQPQAYAAALPLYGKDSACWATSAQSAGCTQACDAAFVDIGSACECTGSSCTACNAPSGTYENADHGSSQQTCNGDEDFSLTSLSVESHQDHSAEVTLAIQDNGYGYGEPSIVLVGTLVCSGTSTLTTMSTDSYGCSEIWTAALTPASDGKSLSAQITRTYKACSGVSNGSCVRSGTLTAY